MSVKWSETVSPRGLGEKVAVLVRELGELVGPGLDVHVVVVVADWNMRAFDGVFDAGSRGASGLFVCISSLSVSGW
jgi:hypothetical protein